MNSNIALLTKAIIEAVTKGIGEAGSACLKKPEEVQTQGDAKSIRGIYVEQFTVTLQVSATGEPLTDYNGPAAATITVPVNLVS